MSKKGRNTVWYYPCYEAEYELIKQTMTLPNESLLFQSKDDAYAISIANRFSVKRDSEGNVITNDEGYGQLENHGKITLISIHGKALSWKKVKYVKMNAKGKVRILEQDLSLNKESLHEIVTEKDEIYQRYLNSPMAQMGGLQRAKQNQSTESISEERDPVAAENN